MGLAENNDIICRLKEIRTGKKMTQAQLGDLVGLKRQAIYDLESGRYLPNTSVALGLARVLGCSVEDIFSEANPQSKKIILVDDLKNFPDPRVSLTKIGNKIFAYPLYGPDSTMEEMKAADGLLDSSGNLVKMLKPEDKLESTALIMGCDPAFSILSQHVHYSRTGAELKLQFASSKKALDRLAKGQTHIAGTHMHARGGVDGNENLTTSSLNGFKGILVAFATFEEGLMVARDNPFNIRNAADLAQEKIRFINREKGAALRELLDDSLTDSNIPADKINGYENTVGNHSQGAHRIRYGACDAALGLKAVAENFNLGFVPMAVVRCDLVIPERFINHPAVKIALDTLNKKTFREELSWIPGYDTTLTGKIIAKF